MNRRALESLAGGAATLGLALGLFLLGLDLAGLRSTRPIEKVAILVAASVVSYAAARGLQAIFYRWGVAAGGVAVIGFGSIFGSPGIGRLDVALVAAVALLSLVGTRLFIPFAGGVPVWLGMAGLLLLLAVLIRILIEGGPLGHDESAYVLKARTWIDNAYPDTGWDWHRGPGQSLMAVPVLWLTSDPLGFRSVAVVLTVLTAGAVWYFGRTVSSNRVGMVAAMVFAVAPSFLRRGVTFLSDIPSTGLLLVVAALVWKWATDESSSVKPLVWAATWGAVAFYIRYQAVLSLGLVAMVLAVLYWPRLRMAGRHIGLAAGTFLVLLLPHFVWATALSGRPWGVLTTTGSAGGRAFLGEGLVDYATDLTYLLAGPVGGIAIVVACLAGAVSVVRIVRGRESGSDRMLVFVVLVALGQIGALGLVSHGEPRFVFFPTALLIVGAVVVGYDLAHRWAVVWRTMAAVGLSMVCALVLTEAVNRMDRNTEARGESYAVLEAVSAEVLARTGAGPGECGIFTGYLPQMTWYSGCRTSAIGNDPLEAFGDRPSFIALFENGQRQPTGSELDEALQQTGEPFQVDDPEDRIGDATVYPVSPP